MYVKADGQIPYPFCGGGEIERSRDHDAPWHTGNHKLLWRWQLSKIPLTALHTIIKVFLNIFSWLANTWSSHPFILSSVPIFNILHFFSVGGYTKTCFRGGQFPRARTPGFNWGQYLLKMLDMERNMSEAWLETLGKWWICYKINATIFSVKKKCILTS